MPKKLIVIFMLCCFLEGCNGHGPNCPSKKKAIFKEGDKVSLVTGTIGTVHRITKENTGHGKPCAEPIYIYHIKVYNEEKKGHVVHRMLEKDLLEFIAEPR